MYEERKRLTHIISVQEQHYLAEAYKEVFSPSWGIHKWSYDSSNADILVKRTL